MDPHSNIKPYGAAMRGDWKTMIDHYHLRFSDLQNPVTSSNDTALHIAVCSQKEQPLKDLLEILPSNKDCVVELENSFRDTFQEDFLRRKNENGNTVLHEATIYGNFEAVKLLVERYPGLVSIRNKYGETPLFTAAEFAEAKIVKFLLQSLPEKILDQHSRLLSIHRQRSGKRLSDNLSILSAAILGQHYDTALMLLKLDESLHSLKDNEGITALQLLAHSPSAFKSGYPMEIPERIFYCWLPVTCRHKVKKFQEETSGQARQGSGDLESGLGWKVFIKESKLTSILSSCCFFAQGYCPARLHGFWKEKRKHVFALRLAEILIQKDLSWIPSEGGGCPRVTEFRVTTSQYTRTPDKEKEEQHPQAGKDNTSEIETSPCDFISAPGIVSEHPQASNDNTSEIETSPREFIASGILSEQHPHASMKENPLFTATRNGIKEIVSMILEEHPYAIEHLNDMGRSILDVAVMYRKKEIFSFVKQKKISFSRLRRVIDRGGNTLLHHVADNDHYSKGTKPGPALQLQEELEWFERVRKVIPSHYVTLQNRNHETAEELFEKNHKKQLEKAQKWIKETTQSCSTVAVLVATVVFAAAYTVPGGSDDEGTPNFINSPYFLVFTVSDVLSLASSLTSLVVFLSLLTSPFELQHFRFSLPRKLMIGFTFLFFSVITTMLSFGATILILIQSEKKLTTLLLSIAAFLPVLVFAIMQFRLYVSFMGSTFKFRKITKKALPSCLAPLLPGGRKLS